MLSWLLFDADHTLFDFDRGAEEALLETLDEFGLPSGGDAYGRYRVINLYYWRLFEERKIGRDEMIRRRFEAFFQEMKIKEDPLDFHRAYFGRLPTKDYLFPGVIELLQSLRSRYRLALVTNGLAEIQKPRLKSSGLGGQFDYIAISAEIGFLKPEQGFFQKVFENILHPPRERVMIIGDNIHADIKGGRDFGLRTCWFNQTGDENPFDFNPDHEIRELEELRSILLKN